MTRSWVRFVTLAMGPMFLIGFWRCETATGLRPALQFGTSWLTLLKAWGPEGVALGVIAFFAHRAFDPRLRAIGGASPIALVAYLACWMLIWTLGVFLPGWVVLGPFAENLKPLGDVVTYGGLGGTIVAAPVALAFAGLALVAIGVTTEVATVLGSALAPTMVALARTGKVTETSALTRTKALVVVLGGGIGYWSIWTVLYSLISGPAIVGVLDVVATAALIGVCAARFNRLAHGPDTRNPPSLPPLRDAGN